MIEIRIRPSVARAVMAVASLIGLFASAYLFYTYVSGAPIVCGLVSGCDLVRASKWAWTFGIPRPFLGLVFYVGVFGLLVARSVSVRWSILLYRLTILAAILGFIESGFLFLIQWLDIRAFCFWCLVSGVSATVLTLVAIADRPMDLRTYPEHTRELRTFFILLLVGALIGFVGFLYLIG